uniref:SPT3 homolog, SAGA and STAGA complex component n=1 Tax=Pundamilia nyererei TaxID=303518 RepID=A0A3B4FT30_9CICH
VGVVMSSPMAGSAPSSSKDRPASRINFIPELQSMMFALGDARRPLQETAALVEDIVHTQLITMRRNLTLSYCTLHNTKFTLVPTFDMLFLQYLKLHIVFLSFLSFVNKWGAVGPAGANQRRQRLAQDFLVWMDQTGELLSLAERQEIDPIKQERMERLERQTRNMDPAQYAEFCESRQLSFAKKASKFRDWLDCSSLELKPNSMAMEILSYLAYETVAQIVDLSLLVKQEMTAKTNPVSHVISASYIHYNTHAESCPATVEPPSGAIQPCHIREAIRRYNYRHTVSSMLRSPWPIPPFTTSISAARTNFACLLTHR